MLSWPAPGDVDACLAGDRPSFLTVVPAGRRPRREIPDLSAGASPVLRALSAATPADHALLVELAGPPDMVRGYEDVKLNSVAAYRERQAELLARTGVGP